MRDLLDGLDRWFAEGRDVAIARVVELVGSGPRPTGSAMAVSADGSVLGSISAGCVESAVVEAALEVLATRRGRVDSYGYTDGGDLDLGTTCGGTVRIAIGPAAGPAVHAVLAEAVRAGSPAALATVVQGPGAGSALLVRPGARPDRVGTLGDPDLDRAVARDAVDGIAAGASRLRRYGRRGDVAVFVESFVPPPRMVIVGAAGFAGALSQVARVLGYRVILCDAREAFATAGRFPAAHEVVVDWPHGLLARIGPGLTARDAVCVLTHEPRFDVPAIVAALGTDAGYVGAMGSRRTHRDRTRRLREAGVGEADLARLYSPIGLDLGALTPEETAVSICAEVLATRTGAIGPAARAAAAGDGAATGAAVGTTTGAAVGTATGAAATGTVTGAATGTAVGTAVVRSLAATDGAIHRPPGAPAG